MICGAPSALRAALRAALIALTIGVVSVGAHSQAAETPPAGATSCSGCHAPAKAAATGIPSIEGRSAGDLKALLDGFRSGAVPATLMNRIMLGFSPEEIEALAQWFGRKS